MSKTRTMVVVSVGVKITGVSQASRMRIPVRLAGVFLLNVSPEGRKLLVDQERARGTR